MSHLDQPCPGKGNKGRHSYYSRDAAESAVIPFIARYPDAGAWLLKRYDYTIEDIIRLFRVNQLRWRKFKSAVKVVHRALFLASNRDVARGTITEKQAWIVERQLMAYKLTGYPDWVNRVTPAKNPHEAYMDHTKEEKRT